MTTKPKRRPTRRKSAVKVVIPAALLALTLTGCSAIGGALMSAGMLISCGPAPLSPDQCGGGWVKTLFAPASDPTTGPPAEPRRP